MTRVNENYGVVVSKIVSVYKEEKRKEGGKEGGKDEERMKKASLCFFSPSTSFPFIRKFYTRDFFDISMNSLLL